MPRHSRLLSFNSQTNTPSFSPSLSLTFGLSLLLGFSTLRPCFAARNLDRDCETLHLGSERAKCTDDQKKFSFSGLSLVSSSTSKPPSCLTIPFTHLFLFSTYSYPMYFVEDHQPSSAKDRRFSSHPVGSASSRSPFSYPPPTVFLNSPFPSHTFINNLSSQHTHRPLDSTPSSSSSLEPASFPPVAFDVDDPTAPSSSHPPSSSRSTLPLPSPLIPQSLESPRILDLNGWESRNPFSGESFSSQSTDGKMIGFLIVPSPEETRISQACQACKARKSKVSYFTI